MITAWFSKPCKIKKIKKGKYVGKPELIKKLLKFFKLSNVKIINDDILNLDKYKKKF